MALARDFSPRVEKHDDRTVTIDISRLGSLLGDTRAIGEELRRTAADRELRIHIAMASATTAAILLARARPGLTIIPPGGEAAALAPLSLDVLEVVSGFSRTKVVSGFSGTKVVSGFSRTEVSSASEVLKRWGLRTLGDLAALPADELSARLGQDGLLWQKWARGEAVQPMMPASAEVSFEESLDLEWPIEDLEPLSFVFARVFEPLCERLARHDRGAVVLHVHLKLVTRTMYERSLQLPAPMRDARVLRTLALLDLESNLPPAAIDRVTVAVEVAEGRVLQFGLFARALPAERLATLMARLGALMGTSRVGAPSLVDSYRPGAFAMTVFAPPSVASGLSQTNVVSGFSQTKVVSGFSRTKVVSGFSRTKVVSGFSRTPVDSGRIPLIIRRFRFPIPARVTLEQGRPVRVVTDRRGFTGGNVERADGPWRSSGDWWIVGAGRASGPLRTPWDSDEWDVVLSDGGTYRISHAREAGGWLMEGMAD